VSTRAQARECGTEYQREPLLALAATWGLDLTGVFADGPPGDNEDAFRGDLGMPGRDRLLAAVRSGRFNCVLIWRLDRIAQTPDDLIDVLRELDQWGVRLVSYSESFDSTTPRGRAMVAIVDAMADLRYQTLRERTQAGLDRKRAKEVGAAPLPTGGEAREALAEHGSVRRASRALGVSIHDFRGIVLQPD